VRAVRYRSQDPYHELELAIGTGWCHRLTDGRGLANGAAISRPQCGRLA
jgi:hypothetical protein